MNRTHFTIGLATALAAAFAVMAGASTDSDRIKEIKRAHKSNCGLSRSGIMAGYMACQQGIPLTNFLANVERAWDKLLAERIAEEQAITDTPPRSR